MIRGRYRSREMDNIVAEAKHLAAHGVTELNVVAQDTTRYGMDLYGKPMLPELLHRLAQIENLRWIRVLYTYPDWITDELLEVMAEEDKIVKISGYSATALRSEGAAGNEPPWRPAVDYCPDRKNSGESTWYCATDYADHRIPRRDRGAI